MEGWMRSQGSSRRDAMTQGMKTQEPAEKEGGGFLHRLFERASTSDAHSASGAKAALDLPIFKGSFFAGTGCRWCGIFC